LGRGPGAPRRGDPPLSVEWVDGVSGGDGFHSDAGSGHSSDMVLSEDDQGGSPGQCSPGLWRWDGPCRGILTGRPFFRFFLSLIPLYFNSL